MSEALLFRTDYEIKVRLMSPLHIGSGESLMLEAPVDSKLADSKKSKETNPLVAQVTKDVSDRPCIPATSVKGALRCIANALCLDQATTLFGQPGDFEKKTPGNIGAILFRTATLDVEGPTFGAGTNKDGIYLASRTRIDPGRGTADSTGLFTKETVAPGAVFRFRFRLETKTDKASFESLANEFEILLSQFSKNEGLSFGGNTSDGDGHMRIDGKISKIRWIKDPATFKLTPGKNEIIAPKDVERSSEERVLEFCCDTPFLIIDGQYEHPPRDKTSAQIRALRQKSQNGNGDIPVVSGSSLSGALRARAEWLRQIDLLQKAKPDTSNPEIIVTGPSDLADLDPVQRLFGVTGAKARLSLRVSKTEGNAMAVTSVKIDRFSGAPIQNALFTTDAATDVSFTLALSLKKPDPETTTFLNKLIDDITANGIILGHGGSKGFGWFSRKESKNG